METTENLPAKRGPKTGNTRLVMTEERKEAFLAAYELSGNFAAAAAIASPNSMAAPRSKPGTASFKALVARDAHFAVAVEEAKERVVARVYDEIYRRAMEGTETSVFQKGLRAKDHDGSPASIRHYDNKLLLRLAAKLDPDWSETKNIQHSIANSAAVTLLPTDLMALSAAQQAQLQDILTTIQASRSGDAQVIDADYEEVDDGNTLAALDELEE
jgi:hypothetical protein